LIAEMSDHPDLDAGVSASLYESDDLRVGEFSVIDEQLLSRALNERREPFARVHRADDKIINPRLVWLPGCVSLK
jgi:hypothetical protein